MGDEVLLSGYATFCKYFMLESTAYKLISENEYTLEPSDRYADKSPFPIENFNVVRIRHHVFTGIDCDVFLAALNNVPRPST